MFIGVGIRDTEFEENIDSSKAKLIELPKLFQENQGPGYCKIQSFSGKKLASKRFGSALLLGKRIMMVMCQLSTFV